MIGGFAKWDKHQNLHYRNTNAISNVQSYIIVSVYRERGDNIKPNKVMASYRVEAQTKERIKEMAEALQSTEAGIIDNLVSWYYKNRLRVTKDKKGVETKEFIPF